MKREYKFRAWHKTAKEMLYPENDKKQSYVFAWLEEGQPVEIMQFTGLKDKNGKDIYEGDVDSINGVCKWLQDTCEYVFENKDGWTALSSFIQGEINIIGNMYENPELL